MKLDRMNVRLDGQPLQELNCFKHLKAQVAADGGCHRKMAQGIEEVYN